jgi:transcriptional adapter 2-alpha
LHQNAAAEKKRPKEEREIFNRYKVFAKLQTAEDFEVLVDGLICESLHPTFSSLSRQKS